VAFVSPRFVAGWKHLIILCFFFLKQQNFDTCICFQRPITARAAGEVDKAPLMLVQAMTQGMSE
jgi:hypothetical protein